MRHSSAKIGQDGEKIALIYLKSKGFKIIEQNWKTRQCEIDIIASKDERLYFVEVKYRSSNKWGGGLDYITPTKCKQMNFAALNWVQLHDYSGDYALSAIAVGNSGVENFVEEILF